METKKVIEKEKLVKCRDCVNFPTMCGYYKNKNKKHPCPDKGEGQHGFKPATEMNLKDTIYSFKMHMRGHDKNTALFDMVLSYLKRGEKFEKIWKRLKRDNKTVTFYDEMEVLEQKYFPKEE